MKRFIPTKIHGVLDYAMSALISTSPLFLHGLKKKSGIWSKKYKVKKSKLGPEQIIPYVIGIGSTIRSVLTKYETGVIKKIPLRVHLVADTVAGVLLLASPFIFRFKKELRIPFIAAGAAGITSALFTQHEKELYPGKKASVMAEYM